MALAMVLAGCGGDDPGDGAAGDPPTEAPAGEPADETAAPDTPELTWVAENVPELDSSVVEAACEEGTLSLYHLVYRNELVPIIDMFEATFPCLSIEPLMASGGALSERFTSEARAGQAGADVWMNTSPAFGNTLAEEGLLAEFSPPNSDRVPDSWKNEGHWYGVGLAHIGPAWNESLVTDEQREFLEGLTDWSQITDPMFAGETGMVHVRAGGTTQLPYYFFQEEYGLEFWEELRDNLEPVIFDGINPASDRLVAGDFVFLPHATADTAVASRYVQGAPLAWTFPEPGLAIPHFIAIAENAPHPNAARLFVAWSLSQEAQEAWSFETGLAPINDDFPDNRPQAQESWYSLPETYWDADWEAISEAIDSMNESFLEIYGE